MTKLTKITLIAAALGSLVAALPAQAGERLDRIEETKVLRVGTPGDYRPFAMKEANGYAGYDIDLVKALVQIPRAAMEGDYKAATIYEARPYITGCNESREFSQ